MPQMMKNLERGGGDKVPIEVCNYWLQCRRAKSAMMRGVSIGQLGRNERSNHRWETTAQGPVKFRNSSITVTIDYSGEDSQPQLTRLKESQTVVVLRLPSHRLMLAARMGFPIIAAELDGQFTLGEDQLALGEEYRSRIEARPFGVAGEDLTIFLGPFDSKEAFFRSLERRSGVEA